MDRSIDLVVDYETGTKKTFFMPKHLKGSIALEAFTLGRVMEKKGDNIDVKDFQRIAAFLAEKVYDNQMTVDEFIDGIDASELFASLMEQLMSVTGDNEETEGKSSREKKS